jgi:hypothetical protein
VAAFGTWSEQAALNAVLAGVAAGFPTVWGLALGSAVPTSSSVVATWEIGAASGYTAQTMPMPTCALGSNTVTNTVAATFGPFSSSQSVSGAIIKNTLATGGTNLMWGSLATAATLTPGESLIFAVGALACSIT